MPQHPAPQNNALSAVRPDNRWMQRQALNVAARGLLVSDCECWDAPTQPPPAKPDPKILDLDRASVLPVGNEYQFEEEWGWLPVLPEGSQQYSP